MEVHQTAAQKALSRAEKSLIQVVSLTHGTSVQNAFADFQQARNAVAQEEIALKQQTLDKLISQQIANQASKIERCPKELALEFADAVRGSFKIVEHNAGVRHDRELDAMNGIMLELRGMVSRVEPEEPKLTINAAYNPTDYADVEASDARYAEYIENTKQRIINIIPEIKEECVLDIIDTCDDVLLGKVLERIIDNTLSCMYDTPKRCYVSGLISGIPIEEAIAKFEQGCVTVQNRYGMTPVNPLHNKDLHEHFGYLDHLQRDIVLLLTCDTVFMMKGWEKSNGANIELMLAAMLGKHIVFEVADDTAWDDALTETGKTYNPVQRLRAALVSIANGREYGYSKNLYDSGKHDAEPATAPREREVGTYSAMVAALEEDIEADKKPVADVVQPPMTPQEHAKRNNIAKRLAEVKQPETASEVGAYFAEIANVVHTEYDDAQPSDNLDSTIKHFRE